MSLNMGHRFLFLLLLPLCQCGTQGKINHAPVFGSLHRNMRAVQRGCVEEDVHYPGGEIAVAGNTFYTTDVAACVNACKGQASCVIGYFSGGICFLKNQAIKANLDLGRTNVYTAYKHCVAGEQMRAFFNFKN